MAEDYRNHMVNSEKMWTTDLQPRLRMDRHILYCANQETYDRARDEIAREESVYLLHGVEAPFIVTRGRDPSGSKSLNKEGLIFLDLENPGVERLPEESRAKALDLVQRCRDEKL